jgi:energy-coupling factor transporter ATP-binding protein EcfA2
LSIVALTGPKGSGKDTVGRLICEMYPQYNPATIAFADPIKKVVQHIFELDPNGVDQYDLFKRTELTYSLTGQGTHSLIARHVVREIGMLMRGYDTHQFNNYVARKIEKESDRLWVITDMRFDDEYILLKKMGAKIVKIIRPSYHYDGHITERGFDDHLVDAKLMNDGDLDFLKTRVGLVMNHIMETNK